MKRGDEGRWEGAHRPRKRRRHVARMGAHARPRAALAPSLIHPPCVLLLDRGFAQGSGRGMGGQAKPLHSFRLVLAPQGRAGGGGRAPLEGRGPLAEPPSCMLPAAQRGCVDHLMPPSTMPKLEALSILLVRGWGPRSIDGARR